MSADTGEFAALTARVEALEARVADATAAEEIIRRARITEIMHEAEYGEMLARAKGKMHPPPRPRHLKVVP
jgi:hypothetical protein